MQWYDKSISQTMDHFQVTKSGLSKKEVKKRQKSEGLNKLPISKERVTRFKIFLDQWKGPLIIVLVIAGIVSGLLGEYIDMSIIFLTVIINVGVGYFQENKANRALEQLQAMIKYDARVMREGSIQKIPAEKIVAGDILVVEAGDKLQADGRIIEEKSFEVKEAALTGESEPVHKSSKTIKKKSVSLGDRRNMAFRGSVVVNGSAKILITAIGANTEIGKIATLVQETRDERTPLQIELARLGKTIAVTIVIIAVLIFIIGVFLRIGTYDILELFETAVAVAVAAIPEGLVISLSVILAIGMQRILKKRSLVRKMVAAETLGSVSVICADKTGTMTEGNMSLTQVITTGETNKSIQTTKSLSEDVRAVLKASILCSTATIEEKKGDTLVVGDSTEVALLKAGLLFDLDKRALVKDIKIEDEIPFDSNKKYMCVLTRSQDNLKILCKGAPEVVLDVCTHHIKDGKRLKITKKYQNKLLEDISNMAAKGYRVLAVAESDAGKKSDVSFKKYVPKSMTFLGLVAITDPVRSDVSETLALAKGAGIHVVMITGDHAATAKAIAQKVGLKVSARSVLSGVEIDALSVKELQGKMDEVTVFARVEPHHKIKIVQAFQARGHVVAMTGDGVNDAPALKGADIGIAVGSGSDVAKEIADLVLLDDNFASIVSAIEEGRIIYQNIKKIVMYLLSGSFAEVILISASLIMGLPLALLPAQILWINIILDSFPNMALAFDKGEPSYMKQKPRDRDAKILDLPMKKMIAVISIASNFVLFSIYYYFVAKGLDIAHVRTLIFCSLGGSTLMYIFSVRSLRHHIWKENPFSNWYLNGSIILRWVLLILGVYFKPLQILLGTVALGISDWGIIVSLGLINILLIEFLKSVYLLRSHKV